MRYSNRFATLVLVVAILVMILNSFYITSLSISDTDPSTYIIVPIIMLPVLAYFMIKNNVKIQRTRKDIGIALILFLIFAILTIVLMFRLSYLFLSYRVDMLLLPLPISAMVILLFGFKNISKFKALMLYPLLASPIILTFILNQNSSFTVFNTLVVYNVVKLFISGATYMAPITIAANGYSVGIGSSCVSIGAFIGLVLFLIPVAYFYNGKAKTKVLWLLSGLVVLLVLNALRMIAITLAWFYYGPTATVAFIHIFIGIILFYATIIIMMLAAKKYGLEIPRIKVSKTKDPKWDNGFTLRIALVIVFAIVYYMMTINYSSAYTVSATTLNNNLRFNYNNTQIADYMGNIANANGLKGFVESSENGSVATAIMFNSTVNSSEPILLYFTVPNGGINRDFTVNNTVLGKLSFLDNRSRSGIEYYIVSNGTGFYIYNTNLPYTFYNGSSTRIGVYMIIPAYVVNMTSCNLDYNRFYTDAYNLLVFNNYNGTVVQKMDDAYCISQRQVV